MDGKTDGLIELLVAIVTDKQAHILPYPPTQFAILTPYNIFRTIWLSTLTHLLCGILVNHHGSIYVRYSPVTIHESLKLSFVTCLVHTNCITLPVVIYLPINSRDLLRKINQKKDFSFICIVFINDQGQGWPSYFVIGDGNDTTWWEVRIGSYMLVTNNRNITEENSSRIRGPAVAKLDTRIVLVCIF